MPRYIDADAIDYKHHKQHKNRRFNDELLGDATTLVDAFYQGVMYVHNCIEETPTADVVPSKYGCGNAPYCSDVWEIDEDE